MSEILRPVGTIEIPPRSDEFRVFFRFLSNYNFRAQAPVGPGPNIRESSGFHEDWVHNRVEPPCGGTTLAAFDLTREATDTEVIAALGGEERSLVTFSEIHAVLQMERFGRRKHLSWEREEINSFYVATGKRPATVRVRMDSGWCVNICGLVWSSSRCVRRVFVPVQV